MSTKEETKKESRNRVFQIILLFGLVSLCGDVVYEGARGVIPPYLVLLGATAVIVGVVGGLGDFIGYAVRYVAGRRADSNQNYWAFVFLGYGITFLAVPLLGFIRTLWLAAFLVIMERLGKAIRTPSRDVLFSAASLGVGRGKAFGIAEALDQIGAMLGPLVVAIALFLFSADIDNPTADDYFIPFAILFIPGLLAIMVLFLAYTVYPKTSELSTIKTKYSRDVPSASLHNIPKYFWLYSLAVSVSVFGLFSAFFILFRASEIADMPSYWIPLLYLFAMAVDAVFALMFGILYDKYGIPLIGASFIFVLFIPIVAISKTVPAMLIAAGFFGIVMGIQESIVRAAVADLSDVETRGLSYGIFYLFYGIAFLGGGALIGFLYEFGMVWIIGVTLVTQVSASILLYLTQQNLVKEATTIGF